MKTIISEKIPRIIKNKKRLEEILNITIKINGKEININGTAINEFEATKVIDALNFGFSFSSAVSIKKENKLFEILNIKDYTNKSNLERIRGRIIGKNGKALKTLSDLTNCNLELKNNEIGIIGEPENLKRTIEALIEIIQGSKHSNVYKGLEKNQPKPIYDLGLKNKKERTTMEKFKK
jgi:ribosomal RNA assembly protein